MKKAFTLVEVLIVVAILGILAAIVVPHFQSQTELAKESAVKDNLRVLRNAIELYTMQHNEMAPGYYYNYNITPIFYLPLQFTEYTDLRGISSTTKSQRYAFGPYMKEFPKNPFNDKTTVNILSDDDSFPESASGMFGWIYKPATRTIKLDQVGTDSGGVRYFDY
jgi:prepilin-type N-terminal cleavage/methylation domain-containing protein